MGALIIAAAASLCDSHGVRRPSGPLSALALVAAGWWLLVLAGGPADAVTPGIFAPISVGGQVGYLNAISCPADGECFAAGQTVGTDQRGLVLHLHGGVWHQMVLPAVFYLNGISCADDRHCAAVGVSAAPARSGVVATTSDGETWRLPAQPSADGGVPLDSVSCAGSFCMTAGVLIPTTGTPRSVVWTTTGGAWTVASLPGGLTPSDGYLAAVDCPAAGGCWLVGQGVWHTSDAGRTWQARTPPESTSVSATWSALDAAYFTDSRHGLVGGGDQCGGDVDHCPGAVFSTTDGGDSWKLLSAGSVPFVESITCSAPGLATCVATSSTFTPTRPGGATSNVTDGGVVMMGGDAGGWRVRQRLMPDTLTSVSCASQCWAVGGDQPRNIGAVFTDRPTGATTVSVVATALPTPAQAFAGTARTVANAAIAATAMLALTFPAQLFNRTFEENYDEILGVVERRFGRVARARSRAAARRSRRRDAVVFAAVLVAGSLIGSLRDPAFGPNARSALSFAATLLAIALMVMTGYAAGRGYRALIRSRADWTLEALPAGLVVAAGCVAVSRIAAFRPGYLYGVICGVAFAGVLRRRDQGRLTAATSVATLAIAAAAWLAWLPVNHDAVRHGAPLAMVLLDETLASVFVGALTGTVISLLPLRFMPGQGLYAWHRGAWAATFGVSSFAVIEILLRPPSDTAHPGSVAWLTAVVLFAVFGGGSLAFREYFARRAPAGARQRDLGAIIVSHLRHHDGTSQDEIASLFATPARHLSVAIDRLERAKWIRRDRAPSFDDAHVPLHLSAAAHALHERRPVNWVRRTHMALGLTRPERLALAHLLQPVEPASNPPTPGERPASPA